MQRDMSFFMKSEVEVKTEVEIPGINKFVYPEGHEKAGQPIPWIAKPISTKQFSEITEKHTTKTIKKGRVISKTDGARIVDEMIIEAVIYPNFKDKEWLESRSFIDPIDLMKSVLSVPGDYSRIGEAVQAVCGFNDTSEEMVDEAKN